MLGKFTLATIANVDQTLLPFIFNKGQGYDQKGTKTVWHRGAQSGLDKRQCTVQLMIFADGKPRIKPLLIFRGKGLRISQAEKKEHDRRVVVKFQENAQCDESHYGVLGLKHVETTTCPRSTKAKASDC